MISPPGPSRPPSGSSRPAWRRWTAALAGGGRGRAEAVRDVGGAADFVRGRAAFVAQSSLYGYIKTRAGFEYFRLFEDDQFLRSVNIAKWNIFAACAGDLSLFCGAHLRRRLPAPPEKVAPFMEAATDMVFAETPNPPDAGPDYPRLVGEAKTRARNAPWGRLADDESPFVCSPPALVYWAPVHDSLKARDAEIVENSIAFKWKEIRAEFRRQADAPSLRRAMGLGSGLDSAPD